MLAFYKGFRVSDFCALKRLYQLFSVGRTIEKQINTKQTATPAVRKIKLPSLPTRDHLGETLHGEWEANTRRYPGPATIIPTEEVLRGEKVQGQESAFSYRDWSEDTKPKPQIKRQQGQSLLFYRILHHWMALEQFSTT